MDAICTHYVSKSKSNALGWAKKTGYATLEAMSDDKYPWADIGDRLRWHRTKMTGLSQREYAKRAKINPTQYANWETGLAHPSMGGALKLLRTFGLSIDFIVEGNTSALPASLYSAWVESPSQSRAK